MRILRAGLNASPEGYTELRFLVDGDRAEISKRILEAKEKPHELVIKKITKTKSRDQVECIWAKIGEIADAIYSSKEDVYEECLRRYGQGVMARAKSDEIDEWRRNFRLVDVVPNSERDDGTCFVKAYRGLSTYNSDEASRLLEGVLDECEEVGLSREVMNYD